MTTRRTGWLRLLVLIFAWVVSACGREPSVSAPDLVLINGKVFTADQTRPWVEAVAVRGERILEVGTNDEMRGLAIDGTRVLDLGGRTVIPGINDAHRHFMPLPRDVHELELTPLEPSWEETRGAIERAVAELEPGTAVHGTVGVTVVTDPAIDRRALDELAPEHPVWLSAFYGHGEIHNSLALARAGVAEDEPDPMGGFFEREDGSQLINGRMFEYAQWNLAYAESVRLSDEDAVEQMRALGERMLATGITSMQNMPLLPLERYLSLLEQADLPIRVRAIRFPTTSPSGRRIEEGLGVGVPSTLVSRARVSGTKWIVDGTPLERGAALRRPYADSPTESGKLNFPPEEIRAMLRESLESDDPLLLHIVGDQGLELLFDSMEAMESVDWPVRRVRIEHGDTLSGDLIERARRLGVIVVQNPTHFAMPQFMVARFGEDRPVGTLRSLVDAGIPIAIGSDGPPDPWLDVMLATIHPTQPAEAITLEEAITAYTLGAAFAESQEDEKGSLTPGKLADLAVLSQDPFSVLTDALPATTSVLTMIGGEIVYDTGVIGAEATPGP